MIKIKNKLYHGVVLPEKDPKNRGRYKIHIDELFHHIPIDQGIWCKNRVHQWRHTMSTRGSYGSYWPLQPGTRVIVSFKEEDPNTGEILKIIHDQEVNYVPYNNQVNDRDDFYMLIKTPIYRNVMSFCEETVTHPRDSVHFYFNKVNGAYKDLNLIEDKIYKLDYTRRKELGEFINRFVWDEDGQHFQTLAHRFETVFRHEKLIIHQNFHRTVNWNSYWYTRQTKHIKAGGSIHITAPNVHIGPVVRIPTLLVDNLIAGTCCCSCGSSGYVPAVHPPNLGYDEKSDKEMRRIDNE